MLSDVADRVLGGEMLRVETQGENLLVDRLGLEMKSVNGFPPLPTILTPSATPLWFQRRLAVKQKVAKHLKEIGAYYFFPATGGYGRSGVPDIVGCYQGRFFGIECKAGKNTTTALQKLELEKIEKSAGIAMVVNEDNVTEIKEVFQQSKGKD